VDRDARIQFPENVVRYQAASSEQPIVRPGGLNLRRSIVVDISRRAMIQGTGAVGAVMLPITAPAQERVEHHSPPVADTQTRTSRQQPTYLFFNADVPS
jgi:hypothetical protein